LYNFYEELVCKNNELHSEFLEMYPLIAEGGNSSVYELSENRILKVFNLENYLFTHNLHNFDFTENNCLKIKDVKDINITINKYMKKYNSYECAMEAFMKEVLFDKSLDWAYYCEKNPMVHFPKIKSIHVDYNSCSYLIEQEKLDTKEIFIKSCGLDKFNSVYSILNFFMFNYMDIAKNKTDVLLLFKKYNLKINILKFTYELFNELFNDFKKIIKKISQNKKMLSNFNKNTDFHTDNLLFKNNNWILNDPIC
jgi:hypothetical protein